MTKNNINFGANQRWLAVSDNYNKRLAGITDFPLYVRLVFLAQSRMNRIGHAEFASGELEALLPTLDKKSGELRSPSQNTICKAVRKAIDNGSLSPESSARCLVIPGHDAQRSAKASIRCDWHGVQRVWGGAVEPVAAEKPQKAVDIGGVSEDQEEISEPQTDAQTPSQPFQEDTPTTDEPTTEEEDMFEDQDQEEDQAENTPVVDINAWFSRDDIEEVSKDVAAYGMVHRKHDSYAYILAVAEEAAKEEYNVWEQNLAMRYTYASMNVDVASIPERDTRNLVMADEW
ncbi:hypothetical protein [Streptomyces sp. E2N171]|uniref:hypothetical protein n=1 Tax=Streptomyces sp. E2N171 TaxID=1851914 RepID=UPI001290AA51|nr:hypothetical protein [Streptomyces sp. E2N171]